MSSIDVFTFEAARLSLGKRSWPSPFNLESYLGSPSNVHTTSFIFPAFARMEERCCAGQGHSHFRPRVVLRDMVTLASRCSWQRM